METEQIILPEPHNLTEYSWFIYASSLKPGGSAIVGNNYLAFYIIHYMALFIISLSLVSSYIVIVKIVSKLRNSRLKVGFSTRLPLYLALADFAWGLGHFTDHLYLTVYEVFPSSEFVKVALSVNMGFFFGYQQLMQTCVAVYTYAGLVHGKKFNLGKFEWKLHLLCFSLLVITMIPFVLMGSFGNAGYWMAHDAATTNGKIMAVFVTCSTTFSACCVTLSYFGVRKAVISSRTSIIAFTASGSTKRLENSTNGRHTTATQCLTTFVWVASCIYCPLVILLWIGLAFHLLMDAGEPISCGLMVAVSNSSGWANAYAYFRNERLKGRKNSGQTMKSMTTSCTEA